MTYILEANLLGVSQKFNTNQNVHLLAQNSTKLSAIYHCINSQEIESFWRQAIEKIDISLKRLKYLSTMREADRKKEWNKGQEKTWFGAYSSYSFKIVRWRLRKINTVLTHSKLKIECKSSLNKWGRARPLIKRIILGKKWLNSTDTFERTQTFIHEAAHIAGVINSRESKKFGKKNSKKLAQKSPLKARRNADNYGYYVMYSK